MIFDKLGIFKTLLYKNFLVRKRHWKLGLFVEILIPLLLFFSVWGMKTASFDSKDLRQMYQTSSNDTIFLTRDSNDYYKSLSPYKNKLLVVPDNQFTQDLITKLKDCYPGKIATYPTEDDMMDDYLTNRNSKFNRYSINSLALVFEDQNINSSTKNFKYKIETDTNIPTVVYEKTDLKIDVFDDTSFTGLQLCVDESLIRMKINDSKFSLEINTRRMPRPAQKSTDMIQEVIGITVCVFAVTAFLIPLCIETSHASNEKFLGVNVLMSMNGVPNYLNLLSWLVTGLIFSLFYIVPILLILVLAAGEDSKQFIEYGNSFIVWLVMTLNIGHLITFGMHVSAYFTRPLFMVTGLIILYVGSTVFIKYGINIDSYEVIPYLGIIFPNMLLYRAWDEINFYEDIEIGTHFKNLFQVTNRAYGIEGSVGFVLLFSIIGIILHFILANYIYAINPGKYGVKKGPFYFLKFLQKTKNTGNYDKVENFEFNDMQGNSFEPVNEGVYSPGIQIRNLKKSYKTSLFSKEEVYALRGITLDFYQGHITALLGHNGAGKTTMMSILSGMISSSEGLVFVNGKNVKGEIDEIMKDMGLCPQENMLFPQLSIAEQVKFFAMLKNKNKSMSVIDSEVTQLLNQLKLLGKRNALAKELSGGQKRRACIAMALIGDSNTLILDEPTSGLDPESKRDIWNILLKIRDRKTILISTHDMEEADVLGDRIAIMHTGQLKSYGTPMYLKKLLGRGNIEVTLSTESWCDPENVRSHLNTQSEVTSDDRGKMILSIPYNDEFPDILDDVEAHKKELGITGMSVSIITLEKVFLKVTQDNDDPSESRQPFTNIEKLVHQEQVYHIWKALFRKKATYTLKNISTTITIFLLLLAAFVGALLILKDRSSSEESVPIRFDMYHNVEVYYKTHRYSKPYSYNYAHVVRDLGAASYEKSGSSTIDQALLQVANGSNYNFHVLMAADFESNEDHSQVVGIALYNPTVARFAQPISINLVSNAILRNVTDDSHSIEISAQQFPKIQDGNQNSEMILMYAIIFAYVIAVVFAFCIYPAVALFVIHPIRESLTNIKHLQKMTGASCLCYWGSMFIFDLAVFFVMTLVLVIGFVIGDFIVDLRMFGWKEVVIQLIMFTLFAANILPLAYIVSFWKRSTSAAIKLLSLLPIALVLIEFIMSLVSYILLLSSPTGDYKFFTYRRVQNKIFLLTPYVSFFQGQVVFFNSSKINGDCAKLADRIDFNTTCQSSERNPFAICCNMECTEDTCGEAVPYFSSLHTDISLTMSFFALAATALLYFGILLILEFQVFERFVAKIRGGIPNNTDDGFEEQVKQVKHEIAYEVCKDKIENLSNGSNGKFQMISENGNEEILQNNRESKNYVFLVYELRKLYGKFVAVQDISFGVNERECFGLLGVNGAGKTTTFKMMTSEVIPNHGDIHLRDKTDAVRRRNYLRQVGYCPQNDAIIRSLNAYDHLRLFARLRGIPEHKVEQEVKNWIDRLNLKVCAGQPSGTYSGGNKRRLIIAMTLIGIPDLVLLDEPTTGVDPAARRSLWNTIQSCQATGQAVILTSHSMEECEVLCNRLAIMVDGRLVCIGPSQELKQRFGAGYDIQLKLNPMKPEDEVKEIKQVLSDALPGEVVDENPSFLLYHVSSTDVTWRKMYNVMKKLMSKYTSIQDFSVLSSTLEQLFLLFAKAANRSNPRNSIQSI